jgi:hypothetical protein
MAALSGLKSVRAEIFTIIFAGRPRPMTPHFPNDFFPFLASEAGEWRDEQIEAEGFAARI